MSRSNNVNFFAKIANWAKQFWNYITNSKAKEILREKNKEIAKSTEQEKDKEIARLGQEKDKEIARLRQEKDKEIARLRQEKDTEIAKLQKKINDFGSLTAKWENRSDAQQKENYNLNIQLTEARNKIVDLEEEKQELTSELEFDSTERPKLNEYIQQIQIKSEKVISHLHLIERQKFELKEALLVLLKEENKELSQKKSELEAQLAKTTEELDQLKQNFSAQQQENNNLKIQLTEAQNKIASSETGEKSIQDHDKKNNKRKAEKDIPVLDNDILNKEKSKTGELSQDKVKAEEEISALNKTISELTMKNEALEKEKQENSEKGSPIDQSMVDTSNNISQEFANLSSSDIIEGFELVELSTYTEEAASNYIKLSSEYLSEYYKKSKFVFNVALEIFLETTAGIDGFFGSKKVDHQDTLAHSDERVQKALEEQENRHRVFFGKLRDDYKAKIDDMTKKIGKMTMTINQLKVDQDDVRKIKEKSNNLAKKQDEIFKSLTLQIKFLLFIIGKFMTKSELETQEKKCLNSIQKSWSKKPHTATTTVTRATNLAKVTVPGPTDKTTQRSQSLS